jgi:hypothetical protein
MGVINNNGVEWVDCFWYLKINRQDTKYVDSISALVTGTILNIVNSYFKIIYITKKYG